MKTHDEHTDTAPRRPAAEPDALGGAAAPLDLAQSPRLLAQRRTIDATFGQAAQRAEAPANATGMPDGLKAGIESMSGMDLSDVRVHRNSARPAQLNALAYAQGNAIHLGPGQERHLPHEAWHVVQQRQGRVQETMQVGNVGVNDDAGLEHEADEMGQRALSTAGTLGPSSEVSGTPSARPASVQRVRFANADVFEGDQLDPNVLPNQIKKALFEARPQDAGTVNMQIDINADSMGWLSRFHPFGGLHNRVGPRVWAQVMAHDWATLQDQAVAVSPIEMGEMTQEFFDHQHSMMEALNVRFRAFIHQNPGRPIRVASLQFERNGNELSTAAVEKDIEDAVAESVESAEDHGGVGSQLMAEVQQNVSSTLHSGRQFQWIQANWETISATHDIFVDVDYYPNRLAESGGGLHKDSVGETLFVNLTYDNSTEIPATEYVADNVGQAKYEATMPEAAAKLSADSRHAQRDDDGSIKGLTLPARGRVSFIDTAIWHAAPLYGRRLPPIEFPDPRPYTRDMAIAVIRAEAGWSDPQRTDAIALLDDAPWPSSGADLTALFRNEESFRFGGLATEADPVDVAPVTRRQRARSVYLEEHPDQLVPLQEQGAQARSFMRSWVIVRPR